jgi:hypothetical protein
MIAGVVFIAAGFLGLALSRNKEGESVLLPDHLKTSKPESGAALPSEPKNAAS